MLVRKGGFWLVETEFNVENLSDGIYLYTIQAGDFVATKKMILLK